MRSCLEREGEKICRTSYCFAQNVARWRLVSGGFPASVPSRRPICPSKALQCTPSGYPDQWSRAGETSAFAEKPHFNYLKFKMNFLEKLCHGMWLFHLHSTLKLQLFYPVFPLAESTAKTFCWLSLWNFKEITNRIPQSRSPSAEILEKKYIFQYIAETKQPYTLTEP